MKVYVIQKGHWSDKRVVAVATSQELADKAAALYATSLEGISTLVMETDSFVDLPVGLRPYSFRMDKQGVTGWISSYQIEDVELDSEWWKRGFVVVDSYLTYHKDKFVFEFYVWAEDEEHAVKIANEKRTVLIATGEWDRLIAKVRP